MQDPIVLDIETIPGSPMQIKTYKEVKCARCDHNPVDHPKQKKDYCAECDEQAALRWHTSQTICITAKPVASMTFFAEYSSGKADIGPIAKIVSP